jgi:pentatricopeptide repeat protein
MEMQSLKMNTETFNIMLRGAAKSKSIGNFHHIFWLMIRRGYSPNADTWLAFIRAMDNPQIKAHILKGMQSKELLHDPRIQKEVVEEFIEMDVTSSLDNNTVHEQFVTQMVDRYGQDWLTTDSANRIIDALGVRGLISRCGDFLEFMHSKDVKLSEASILTVLHHCEKQDNPQGALEIIRRVSSLIDFRPTEAIYHSIFNIAWEARLHCVARVVWHYACLNAATTYLMRRRICAGLDTAILKSSSSQSAALKFLPRKEWAATACRFILLVPSQISKRDGVILSDDIGDIRPPTSYRGTIHASTSAFEGNLAAAENSVENLEDRLSPGEEISNNVRKSTRRSLSEEIVWEQLHAFQFWTPQRHFTDILMEAFETDMEMASSIGGTADNRLEWLAQRAPAMPLYEKKRALPNWYSKRGYLRPRVQPLLKRA